ncbi:MAG: LamG domain-containing protein, partial [Candidatus Pacearchaeota archaeon]|nr:LamG domain-containing protein [Candidatus Pacearchaeota archaeon]
WYLDAYVNDTNGNPVDNATVYAWDNERRLTFNETTNSSGRILRQNVSEYFESISGKFFFTNYSLKAVKNPQSPIVQVNLTSNKQVNLTLDLNAPLIYFVEPTPANNTRKKSTENWAYINVTVEEENEHGAYIDWNRSLVAYWKFNEEDDSIVKDNSTWGNDCYLYDNAFFSAFSKRGNAVALDGDGDYVSCPSTSSLSSTFRNRSFSIETWVYFNDDSYDDRAICEKAGFDIDEWLHILRRNMLPMFGFYADDLIGNTVLTSGKWWHLVFTWNAATRERKIYVNGILDAEDISNGYLNVPALTDFIIGSYNNGAYLNGYIDEFKIWNRVLNEQEINASYNNGLYRLERNFTGLAGGRYEYYACSEDEAGNSNCTETRILKINRPPTAPELIMPENGTHTYNRTPSFEWQASSDVDGDSLQYVWILHCDSAGIQESCSPVDERIIENITETSYTPTTILKNFWDTQEYYLWKVKAWDGFEYGPESSIWHLYIDSLVALSTINDTAAFGSMAPGTADDTTDNDPWPISFQNDGNCFVNVSIFGTRLWQAVSGSDESYQFKFDYLEENSFNWDESVVTWTNVPISSTILNVLSKFNYSDLNDSAELDIKLAPLGDEPPGAKSSNIALTGNFVDVPE